jgi:hypothetical protein
MLAQAVRESCLQAAREAYEQASISGLCHEGAWECALDAIGSLDIEGIIKARPPLPSAAPGKAPSR